MQEIFEAEWGKTEIQPPVNAVDDFDDLAAALRVERLLLHEWI
ncbi:MAG TPA: hypothetical protein VLN59_16425 [Burkholderiales bacterium]|nr:hypothetical protein [Burkholderiales bacterium]